jgi:hypothetical protein
MEYLILARHHIQFCHLPLFLHFPTCFISMTSLVFSFYG